MGKKKTYLLDQYPIETSLYHLTGVLWPSSGDLSESELLVLSLRGLDSCLSFMGVLTRFCLGVWPPSNLENERKRKDKKKTIERKTRQKWEKKRHRNVKNSYSNTSVHDRLEEPRQNVYHTMHVAWSVQDSCLSATSWHTQQMFYEHFMNKATLVRNGGVLSTYISAKSAFDCSFSGPGVVFSFKKRVMPLCFACCTKYYLIILYSALASSLRLMLKSHRHSFFRLYLLSFKNTYYIKQNKWHPTVVECVLKVNPF